MITTSTSPIRTRRDWLAHVLLWCQARGDRHALLLGKQLHPGVIEVAAGLFAVAAPEQPFGIPDGLVVAAVPLDVLYEWLRR